MSKPTVIAFSGGCFSGKTTSMNRVREALKQDSVIVLNEAIREKLSVPIDVIRKNPSEYLKLQSSVIRQKMQLEYETQYKSEDKIILTDRSMADSLFYLLFYVDKAALSASDLNKYYQLYKSVMQFAEYAYKYIYTHVLFFEPLELTCSDTHNRPELLYLTKDFERDQILMYNRMFINNIRGKEITYIDLNKWPNMFDKNCIGTLFSDLKISVV